MTNNIKINSDAFDKQCKFIKENTTCNTKTSIVRQAVRNFYLQVREDKKQELKSQLEELEK